MRISRRNLLQSLVGIPVAVSIVRNAKPDAPITTSATPPSGPEEGDLYLNTSDWTIQMLDAQGNYLLWPVPVIWSNEAVRPGVVTRDYTAEWAFKESRTFHPVALEIRSPENFAISGYRVTVPIEPNQPYIIDRGNTFTVVSSMTITS